MLSMSGVDFVYNVYPWFAVLVLPVNSSINPFLYTFSNIYRKRQVSQQIQEMYIYIRDRSFNLKGREGDCDILKNKFCQQIWWGGIMLGRKIYSESKINLYSYIKLVSLRKEKRIFKI